MSDRLAGFRVAILATDLFQEDELTEPRKALEEAGATTVVIAPHGGEIKAAQHEKATKNVQVDETLAEADPEKFDVGRTPNDHFGFGAPGPHFCLGAHLARQEITVMWRELLSRTPGIHATNQPVQLASSFVNGIKHLDYRFD